jgi:hypothetical protein
MAQEIMAQRYDGLKTIRTQVVLVRNEIEAKIVRDDRLKLLTTFETETDETETASGVMPGKLHL